MNDKIPVTLQRYIGGNPNSSLKAGIYNNALNTNRNTPNWKNGAVNLHLGGLSTLNKHIGCLICSMINDARLLSERNGASKATVWWLTRQFII